MEWQLPDGVDRLTVNAALTTLTERWDFSAACLVIRAFADLPQISPRQTKRSIEVSGQPGKPSSARANEKYNPPSTAIAHIGSFRVVHVNEKGSITAAITFEPSQMDPLVLLGEQPPSSMFSLEHVIGTPIPLGLYRLDSVPRKLPLWVRLRDFARRACSPRDKFISCYYGFAKTTLHIITEKEFDSILTD